ncbi:hypothetical protein V8F20_004785 [Naviculisporaceae sp. PSN 640]
MAGPRKCHKCGAHDQHSDKCDKCKHKIRGCDKCKKVKFAHESQQDYQAASSSQQSNFVYDDETIVRAQETTNYYAGSLPTGDDEVNIVSQTSIPVTEPDMTQAGLSSYYDPQGGSVDYSAIYPGSTQQTGYDQYDTSYASGSNTAATAYPPTFASGSQLSQSSNPYQWSAQPATGYADASQYQQQYTAATQGPDTSAYLQSQAQTPVRDKSSIYAEGHPPAGAQYFFTRTPRGPGNPNSNLPWFRDGKRLRLDRPCDNCRTMDIRTDDGKKLNAICQVTGNNSDCDPCIQRGLKCSFKIPRQT